MVSQGTYLSSSDSINRREAEALDEQFDWCRCEPREIAIGGISWKEDPGRPYLKCQQYVSFVYCRSDTKILQGVFY